jgi:outer membrane protein assembly factor BamB
VRPIYAIRPGASGDISLPKNTASSEAIAWSNDREGTYIPTPLVYRGMLYTLNVNGILTAYDAKSGQRVYRSRIGDGGSFAASLIAADGRIYASSEDGDIFVIQAGREYLELGRHPMGEVIMSTPAIADGLIVVRTNGHLFGLGAPER